MSISLRASVAIAFAALIIAISATLSVTIGSKSSREVQREIGSSLMEISYQTADKLDYYMSSRAGEIDVLSKLDRVHHPEEPDKLRGLLDQLKASFPAFTWVGFLDAGGKVVASTDGILTGADISSRPVFKEGANGRYIGDVHDAVLLAKLLPSANGEPLQFVDISTPVRDANGKLIGVLAAHLSWEWSREVQNAIMEPLREHMKNVELFIVSRTGNDVLLGPKAMVGRPLQLQSVRNAQAGDNHWLTERWPDGKSYLTGYAFGDGYGSYPGLGWTVLVRQPADIAYAPVKELQRYVLYAGILFAVAFAVIGWFVAGAVSRPLKRIAAAADKLRGGEKAVIPHHRGIKDIASLSLSLRSLVDDLTRTETALGRMESLAHHDKLTGLPNRISLDSHLEQAMRRAARQDEAIVFLYLDLDGFKSVNDTLGHQAGDALLQQAALRLKRCVSEDEIVARLGGDEFLALLHTAPDEAIEKGHTAGGRIIASLNEPFLIDGQIVRIGCSVGGAVWPADSADPIETMRLADMALYASKRKGKNCTTFGQSPPAA